MGKDPGGAENRQGPAVVSQNREEKVIKRETGFPILCRDYFARLR
jgi:hypothetical protein